MTGGLGLDAAYWSERGKHADDPGASVYDVRVYRVVSFHSQWCVCVSLWGSTADVLKPLVCADAGVRNTAQFGPRGRDGAFRCEYQVRAQARGGRCACGVSGTGRKTDCVRLSHQFGACTCLCSACRFLEWCIFLLLNPLPNVILMAWCSHAIQLLFCNADSSWCPLLEPV